jgi:WD40 repeat protein
VTTMPVSALAGPYKGLAAFDDTELDALLFFGRENDTEVIANNLLASRFTVLYGATGVGKSSILRAGVARRVRALAPDALVVVHDSWAGDAVGELAGAVASALPGVEPPAPDAPLAERLAELVDRFGGRLYLVLDQFEEVFTYSDAAALAEELSEVVTRPKLRVNVLLALREDALSDLDVFTGRIPDVFGNYLALDRLDRTAGRAAIVGPVARYNELSPERPVQVEPDLVEAVLDQVEVGRVVLGGVARGASDTLPGGGIEAPYLQLVMQRLWEAEREHGSPVLRRATLDDLGGAQEIVREHLDRAVEALAPGERDVAARVFHHLVTPSGTKIAHGVRDLAQYAGVREEEVRPVLASLGAERILRPLDGRFEIFHDVLADAVLAWRTRHEAERALELQRAEAQRRHRRLLALLGVALVALAVMAALTVYALTQRADARAEARRAQASKLEAEASALIPVAPVQVDPELGLLLAAEAARLSPSSRGADILRRALLVSHLRRVLPERGVTSASFSADGNRLAVGTEGGIAIYAGDARTKLATLRVGLPVAGVSRLPGPPRGALSPDGRLVLTTDGVRPARIWNVRTRRVLRSFGRAPTAASFSSDGSLVLTVEPSGVRVWRADDGSAVAALRQTASVREASFGPDGRLVATIGAGPVARVFDARSGRLIAAVDQKAGLTSATITLDGRRLVTTGKNRTPRVWTLHGGGRPARKLRGHRGPVTAAVVSPDGERLVTTSIDTTARVWALPSGEFVRELDGHTNRVEGAAFSRDGLSVVTWSTDGTARVWDVQSGAARVTLTGPGPAAFDPSGDAVLTTGAGLARVWRSRVDNELRRMARVPRPISAASFSGDGRIAAVAGRSGISVLRASDGRHLAQLPARSISVVAVSRTGSLVAGARERRVSLWRVPTGEPAGTIDADEPATAIAFSPDARRLAVATVDGKIRIWTVAGRRAATFSAPERVRSLAFSPSGDRLAAGLGNGSVAAWSVRDGRRLDQPPGFANGRPVLSVAFSPAGGRFVTTGSDSPPRVWSAARGQPPFALSGHVGSVSGAAFSPNGHWVVTAGPGKAGLWDIPTRQRLLFLEGHRGRLLAASFDAAGRQIATVGVDGTLRTYACEICGGTPELLQLAERQLAATGRKLTPAERRRYFDEG